jgi:LacI family transcriptional regulator
MASQSDVARLANVSFMTVSRVVNGDPRVKPETRERVQRAIEELRYRPNAAARALNRQRSMTIALVLPRMDAALSEPYFSQLIYHVERALMPLDYSILIVSGENRGGVDPTLLFDQKKADGVMILGAQIGDPRLEALSARGCPTVLLHARSELPGISWVDVDNAAMVDYFVDRLHRLGHRRIAFISGDLSVPNARQRLDAFRARTETLGLPCGEDLHFPGDWSSGSGFRAFARFHALEVRPSAVIASNDHMAIGFLKAAAESGVSVPDDLSVVGIDDIEMAAYTTPSLTTMRQPLRLIASGAVEALAAAMDDGSRPASRLVLGAEPVLRESCGPISSVSFS